MKIITLERLNSFLTQLKALFATKTDVDSIEADTDTYVLNVDYSLIAFDTSEIVTENTTV